MANSTATKGNATGSTSSRRSKKNQEVNLKNTSQVDGAATLPESSNTDKGGQVIAMTRLKLQETPKDEATQVSDASPLPGNRPIASSDLNLSEAVSIMGNRPVDASNIQVLGTISEMGDRPIVASSIKVMDTISVSGERPIAASSIQLTQTKMIMGNRPIASNYIDGDEDLMGYLD
jgi:hypothetical protein